MLFFFKRELIEERERKKIRTLVKWGIVRLMWVGKEQEELLEGLSNNFTLANLALFSTD